jgi:hypothetical protein
LPVPGAGFTFSTPSTGAAESDACVRTSFFAQPEKAKVADRQTKAITNLLSIAKLHLSF